MVVKKNLDFLNKLHSLVGDKKFIMTDKLRNELEIDLYQGKSYMQKFSWNDIVKNRGKVKLNKRDLTKYQLSIKAIATIKQCNEN